MELDPKLVAALNSKFDLFLEALAVLQGGPKKAGPGFQMAPRAKHVYIGKSDDKTDKSGWYFYDDKRVSIEADSLVGELCMVGTKLSENSEHGDKLKLVIGIKADLKYVIQAGIGTTFAQTILDDLRSASTESLLGRPIRITVKPGDKKVVFGSVSFADTDEKIRGERTLVKGEREKPVDYESRVAKAAEDLGKRLKGESGGASRKPGVPANSWDDTRA